jgi:hypothetical protein
VAWGRRTNLSANTHDLYNGSIVRLVDFEGTFNDVASRFDSFPGVTGDEYYAMDTLFELVSPGWFVVIWVVQSWLLTTRVAEEFCVGKLPKRKRPILARYGLPFVV